MVQGDSWSRTTHGPGLLMVQDDSWFRATNGPWELMVHGDSWSRATNWTMTPTAAASGSDGNILLTQTICEGIKKIIPFLL